VGMKSEDVQGGHSEFQCKLLQVRILRCNDARGRKGYAGVECAPRSVFCVLCSVLPDLLTRSSTAALLLLCLPPPLPHTHTRSGAREAQRDDPGQAERAGSAGLCYCGIAGGAAAIAG
jgi:hypothetical protein